MQLMSRVIVEYDISGSISSSIVTSINNNEKRTVEVRVVRVVVLVVVVVVVGVVRQGMVEVRILEVILEV